MTAYSGYKSDAQFLYIVIDVVSVTSSLFNRRASAGTAFDPKHDGGSSPARADDFVVLPIWQADQGFNAYVRYGQSDGKWGSYQAAPVGLVAASALSPSPQSVVPHLFYEMRVPLSLGGLQKYINGTIGISQEAYNNYFDAQFDSLYPMGADKYIVSNWANATFSMTMNPNPTVPAIPEFMPANIPVALIILLTVGQIILRRRSDHYMCK
jgi:hypothetical protein